MLYTLGIDIGSVTSKCVLLGDGRHITGKAVVKAGAGTGGPEAVVQEVLELSRAPYDDIVFKVVTGYGRVTYEEADEEVSEITCHAKGAYFHNSDVRTVVDIGGQDAKVIKINEFGNVVDFSMNDKCAAGTGRFLEVMAQALGYTVDDLAELDLKARERIQISNTCTVFAESEVISHLSAKRRIEDIVAGIHWSVARRISGLAGRVGLQDTIMMTGGVAMNEGVVRAFKECTGHNVVLSPHPQLNGALGAALIAYQKHVNKSRFAKTHAG